MKRTKFAEKVGADAKQAVGEYRASPVFLERNKVFEHSVQLPPDQLACLDKILRVSRKQTRLDLDILVANLWAGQKKCISV